MYINSKFKFSNTTSSIVEMVVDFLCSNKYFYKIFFWFLIPFFTKLLSLADLQVLKSKINIKFKPCGNFCSHLHKVFIFNVIQHSSSCTILKTVNGIRFQIWKRNRSIRFKFESSRNILVFISSNRKLLRLQTLSYILVNHKVNKNILNAQIL